MRLLLIIALPLLMTAQMDKYLLIVGYNNTQFTGTTDNLPDGSPTFSGGFGYRTLIAPQIGYRFSIRYDQREFDLTETIGADESWLFTLAAADMMFFYEVTERLTVYAGPQVMMMVDKKAILANDEFTFGANFFRYDVNDFHYGGVVMAGYQFETLPGLMLEPAVAVEFTTSPFFNEDFDTQLLNIFVQVSVLFM